MLRGWGCFLWLARGAVRRSWFFIRGCLRGQLGAIPGLSRPSWELHGVVLEPSWGHLKASWGHVGAILEPACSRLGAIFGVERPLLFLRQLFLPSWSQLTAMLGPSWRHLGASWGILEPSWIHLGSSWSHLGAILRHLGASLGPLWSHPQPY